MPSVLLHSLMFYRELIEELIGSAGNPDVVEIGSEAGEFSEVLVEAASLRGGTLTVVEPSPSERLRRLAAGRASIQVVPGFSPNALENITTAGTYVIDGDHNYATVRAELLAVFGRADSADTIAVMHDIGWPSGRRDQYYAPHRLSTDDVLPYSFTRGAVLGKRVLAADGRGFRGEGAFAFALEEGGPRNGVLTAVEDVVRNDPDLELLSTPLVFGLGVVGRPSSPRWQQVRRAMAPYLDNPVLARAEENRLQLLLRVIELQDTHPRARLRWVRSRVVDRVQGRRRG